jgi:hypothetical protein
VDHQVLARTGQQTEEDLEEQDSCEEQFSRSKHTRSRFVDDVATVDINDDADEDESDDDSRSRQQTSFAVVPFIALPQNDGVPSNIEMICKNTDLLRRRTKCNRRASRTLEGQ